MERLELHPPTLIPSINSFMILKFFQSKFEVEKCERQVNCFWMNLSGKQQCEAGYALSFAMPIGYIKVINPNQTEHQVAAG
jgi:hypothetical protein